MTMIWSLLAIGLSAAGLLALGMGDPKRRRTLGLPVSSNYRALLLVLVLVPGLVLALTGQPAAFLIWLGGSVVAGWVVSTTLPARRKVPPPQGTIRSE